MTVPKDQLALLIGKKGRNIRLASKLLGWELVAEAVDEIQDVALSDIKGLGDKTKEVLIEAGYDTAGKVSKASVEELSNLKGIGVKSAEKIISLCLSAVKTKSEQKKAIETAEESDEEKAKKFFRSSGDEVSEGNKEESDPKELFNTDETQPDEVPLPEQAADESDMEQK
ncbi:MAG: hypothetical protein KJ983_03600 [Candidatus Omnitrophica bacterium]|nr:hypothetical protein [Candidatus Omnitrophota bacterium]